MTLTAKEFLASLPTPAMICHQLDVNAAERLALRNMLKLAKKVPRPLPAKPLETTCSTT